ncbi:MAG: hypothetical protein O3A01_03185 [bacterium]|nr:hypothetical protein [bacterium]
MHPIILAFIGVFMPFLSGIVTYWLSPFSSFRTFWISAFLSCASGASFLVIALTMLDYIPTAAISVSLAPLRAYLTLSITGETLGYLLLLNGLIIIISILLSMFLNMRLGKHVYLSM